MYIGNQKPTEFKLGPSNRCKSRTICVQKPHQVIGFDIDQMGQSPFMILLPFPWPQPPSSALLPTNQTQSAWPMPDAFPLKLA